MIGSSWWAVNRIGFGAAISDFAETRIKKFAEFDANASSKMYVCGRGAKKQSRLKVS